MNNQLIEIIIDRHNQYLKASRDPRFSARARASKVAVYVELEYILITFCNECGVPFNWQYAPDGTIDLHK